MSRPRPAAGGGRRLGVAPERLGRWLDGVAERHGAFTEVSEADGAVHIACADTTALTLRAPFGWTPEPALLSGFTAAARTPHRAAVLLVRRGRWAVGVFDGGGPRRLQGRRPPGPGPHRRRWHVAAALRPPPGQPDRRRRLARRRDRRPCAAAARRVGRGAVHRRRPRARRRRPRRSAAKPLAALRREPALDVGEPTKAVLLETPNQFRAVDVHIVEPGDREARSPYEDGGPFSQRDR